MKFYTDLESQKSLITKGPQFTSSQNLTTLILYYYYEIHNLSKYIRKIKKYKIKKHNLIGAPGEGI